MPKCFLMSHKFIPHWPLDSRDWVLHTKEFWSDFNVEIILVVFFNNKDWINILIFREPIKVEKNGTYLKWHCCTWPPSTFLSLFTTYFFQLLTSFSELWKNINICTSRIFSQILFWWSDPLKNIFLLFWMKKKPTLRTSYMHS